VNQIAGAKANDEEFEVEGEQEQIEMQKGLMWRAWTPLDKNRKEYLDKLQFIVDYVYRIQDSGL